MGQIHLAPMDCPDPIASSFFLFKHFKHPVGDHKATDHVEGTQQNSQKTKDQGQVIIRMRMAHNDNRADDHDAVNGIGARHKRGVQDGGHIGDHLNTQQNAQDNNVDGLLIFKKKLCHSSKRIHDESGRMEAKNAVHLPSICQVHHWLVQIFNRTCESAFGG